MYIRCIIEIMKLKKAKIKDYILQIRCNKDEMKELQKAADEMDLPASSWVRHVALLVARKEVIVPEHAEQILSVMDRVVTEKFTPYMLELKNLTEKVQGLMNRK